MRTSTVSEKIRAKALDDACAPPPTCSARSPTCARGRRHPDYGKKSRSKVNFHTGNRSQRQLTKDVIWHFVLALDTRRGIPCCSDFAYLDFSAPDSSIVADMDILIGYRSALEYWRLVGPGFLRGYQERRTATRPRDESVVVPLRAAGCMRKPPTGRMQAARSRNRRAQPEARTTTASLASKIKVDEPAGKLLCRCRTGISCQHAGVLLPANGSRDDRRPTRTAWTRTIRNVRIG